MERRSWEPTTAVAGAPASRTASMGRALQTYRPQFGKLLLFLAVGIPFAWFGAAVLADDDRAHVAGGLFCLAIGSLMVGVALSLLTARVTVHEGGLVVSRFGRIKAFPWGTIQSLLHSVERYESDFEIELGVNHHMTIERDDGLRARLSFLADAYELRARIDDAIGPRMLARSLDVISRNGSVPFGDLRVSRVGLQYKRKMLRWEQYDGASIDNGQIRFKKAGGWFDWAVIDAGAIPNVTVFCDLVNRVAAERA